MGQEMRYWFQCQKCCVAAAKCVNALAAYPELLKFGLQQLTKAEARSLLLAFKGFSSPSPSMSTVSCPEYPELQEKLHRLAMARDSLSLQVSVLSEQVGAQKEKIRDLENMLASTKANIVGSENILTEPAENDDDSDGTGKIDLKAEVTKLKLKCAQLERDKFETEKKLRSSQSEIEHLSHCMQDFLAQRSMFSQQTTPTTAHLQNSPAATAIQHSFYSDGTQLNTDPEIKFEKLAKWLNGIALEKFLDIINIAEMFRSSISKVFVFSAAEMEQLRLAVQKLIVDNEQKNIQINSLRNALDEHCCAAGSNRLFDGGSNVQSILNDSANTSRFYNEQDDSPDPPIQSRSRSGHFSSNHSYGLMPNGNTQSSPLYVPGYRSNSPQRNWNNCNPRSHNKLSLLNNSCLPIPSSSNSLFSSQNYRGSSSPAAARQLAAELDELRRVSDEVHQSSGYGPNNLSRSHSFVKSSSTFALQPKKQSLTSSGGVTGEYSLLGAKSKGSLSVTSQLSYRQQVNKWIHNKIWHSRFSKRTTSTPNLGLVVSDDEVMRTRKSRDGKENGKFKRDRTRSSLRNLFGKITRSTSKENSLQDSTRENIQKPLPSARYPSAGPVAGAIAQRLPVSQFVELNNDQICEWMAEIGFSQYVPQVDEFVKNGTHLLNMTDQEFEKDLGIKNSLHRKRLRCILNAITCDKPDPSEGMDIHQVLRWLDEIGLPQYRESFAENMIDGQMLTLLTAQDLVDMKVYTALHHASIRRGIQFLHANDFCLYHLENRLNSDLIGNGPCPSDVEKWSHLCTCQWLKTIDLAEFTPNLLCSGINGPLMVHEPTFTAESLAEVLQIPMHKTLLRRHLTTHFNQLLGQEIISHKREVLAQPFQIQLTPYLKVKFLRKGFSLSRKRGKNEVYVEADEPICPPLGIKTRVSRNVS
uniref:SAM domain-containing protein n=1 Tax=Syphacia muris TaxID=451379 RepID=A0A158R5I1_9BILA